MTIYIHNPPEPHAVSTQPVINITDSVYGLNPTYTLGRCGQCPSCPKVWKLEVPLEGTSGTEYAGTYYLFKIPYAFDPDSPLTFAVDCTWGSRVNEIIPLANPRVQWILKFEYHIDRGFAWAIYSPLNEGGLGNRARWEFRGNSESEFRCLRANVFTLFNIEPSDFVYQPETLTITPFHA